MDTVFSYEDLMLSLDAEVEIDNNPEQKELTAALNVLDEEIASG